MSPRPQNYAERRLDQLVQIGRVRDLTSEEQIECMLRAKQARRHAKRRQLYADDDRYRSARIEDSRAYRRSRRRSSVINSGIAGEGLHA